MATVTRYVDPDATGAGDGTSWTDAYTSLFDCEAAEDGGSNAGNDLVVKCRASSGTADSADLQWGGFTYDSVIIEAASGDESVKTGIDNSRYRLTGYIQLRDDNLTVDGIQFDCATTYAQTIIIKSFSGNPVVTIKNCYIQTSAAGTEAVLIGTGTQTVTANFQNCIFRDNIGSVDGIDTNGDGDTATFYNCVIEGFANGFDIVSGDTVTIKNCAIFNNTDDINDAASSTIDYCASDDGDGTNAVAPSGGNWANEFSDPTNGDFTLLNTGNLYDAGVGPGSDASVPTTDIDGDSRSGSTCDIGVDEYVAAGVSGSSTDGSEFSDTVTANWAPMYASVSDGPQFSDTPVAMARLFAAIADGTTFSESDIAGTTLYAVTTDGTVVGDVPAATLVSAGVISAAVTDGITMSDTATVQSRLLAAVADGITLSDVPEVLATLLASVVDGVEISDVTNEASLVSTGLISMTASAAGASITVTVQLPVMQVTSSAPEITVS